MFERRINRIMSTVNCERNSKKDGEKEGEIIFLVQDKALNNAWNERE
jgi:hypothetical protein